MDATATTPFAVPGTWAYATRPATVIGHNAGGSLDVSVTLNVPSLIFAAINAFETVTEHSTYKVIRTGDERTAIIFALDTSLDG